MFPVNCYVLSDETQEAVIIDAGCFYPNEQQELKRYITENNLKVTHLLNTHLHLDHIFGNPFVSREFGLQAEAHKDDEFWLNKAEEQCHLFGFNINEPTVPLGRYIQDKEQIQFGNTLLEAIHVPGHSPGSLVFYVSSAQCMFSGDVLFNGSIGRSDLTGGDFNTLRNGIIERLFILPDETIVYPGHGDSTTLGREKITNPFFR